MAQDERKAILAELRAIARRLGQVPDLRTRQLDLFRRGHKAGLLKREMAEASGVGETAVIKAMKRADDRA